MEALRTPATHLQDLVLDNIDGSSSLAVSMSVGVELLDSQIDVAAANGVCWGSRSALVAAVSHFPELKSELELLGSGCNADLTEDEVDALWTWVRVASYLLASFVPSLAASGLLDGVGE
jgi:hypothetical protein